MIGLGSGAGANNFRRNKFSSKIKRTDPYLKRIYSDIVEYNSAAANKMKPEKLKVHKSQIIKHLRKRYGPSFTEKVMSTFNF